MSKGNAVSKIRSIINRSDREIHSQNKVVKSYAQQLKSSVISSERRKAILKEMKSELTAKQYRRSLYLSKRHGLRTDLHISVDKISLFYSGQPTFTAKTINYQPERFGKSTDEKAVFISDKYSRAESDLKVKDTNKYNADTNFSPESNEKNTQSLIQTGGQAAAPSVQKAVDNSYLKTQRSAGNIKTARISYSPEVISSIRQLDNRQKAAEYTVRRNAVIKLKCKRLKNRRYRVIRSETGSAVKTHFAAAGVRTLAKKTDISKKSDSKGKYPNLKNKKYTIAKADSDGSAAIESVQLVQASVGSIAQTGGMLKTAVKGTAKGAESIKTMIKSGVKIGSAKDIGRIATAAGGGVKNIAGNTVNKLLKTKIDKSKITDTGTETIKQGFTELRHADNARKAVLNTARTSINTVKAIRDMPKNTRAQIQRIRNNARRAKEIAKKAAAVIKKILTSKVGLIILLIIALLLIVILLLSGIVTVICSIIGGLFGWMCPDGDTSEETIQSNIQSYIAEIQQCETDIQSEIDKITGLEPEYRYDGTQIEGLDNFKNRTLDLMDYETVLAVLATQKFRKIMDGETDFHFTDEEIRNAVEMFYNFDYRYEYGYCPGWDCSINENSQLSMAELDFGVTSVTLESDGLLRLTLQGTTYAHTSDMNLTLYIYLMDGGVLSGYGGADIYNGTWRTSFFVSTASYVKIDWSNVYMNVTTVYCDNPNHCYLYGEVVNYGLETVMRKAVFDNEERKIFEAYLEQIKAVTGG